MNSELRDNLEWLAYKCEDKAITPDVQDDIKYALDYIDELEKELKTIKEGRKDKTKDSVYMKMSKEHLVKIIGVKNDAISYITSQKEKFRGIELGKEIENPEEVLIEKGCAFVKTILNEIMDLSQVPSEYDETEYPSLISLKTIEEHIKCPCYEVIYETPMGGYIYRYNNYGNKEWIIVGVMYGFA